MSAHALSAGWLSSCLPLRKHAQVLKTYERCRRRGRGAGEAGRRVFGPPLCHPLDPRHEYLAEEAALLDEHVLDLESKGQSHGGDFLYGQFQSPRLKAAEDRADYGKGRGRPVRRARKRK